MSKRRDYPSVRIVFTDWRMFLAFGLGSGLSRIIPGTLGTLMAVPFYYLMVQLPQWAYISLTLLSCVVGIHFCGYASKKLGVHDHGGIVWDEFAGFWITMTAVPTSWPWVLAGFVVFRFFDMLKPWPIRWLDRRIHGGFGIMFDDIVAGLMSLGCLQAYRFWM